VQIIVSEAKDGAGRRTGRVPPREGPWRARRAGQPRRRIEAELIQLLPERSVSKGLSKATHKNKLQQNRFNLQLVKPNEQEELQSLICLIRQEELYCTAGVESAMSFDTLTMKAITDELRNELTGAPVQKVYEPERNEIIIHLYSHGSQPGLLLSIDPSYARVHLTEKRSPGKEQPSPFCMLLRKYLVGGRAASFSNPPLERILEIEFDPPEGLPPVKLIAEIMSRRSNIILVDKIGTILGAAKTASWDKNPARVIMPGEKYQPPPAQNKLNPLEMEFSQFANTFSESITSSKPEKALFSSVGGVSPLAARELLHRAGWQNKNHDQAMPALFEEIKDLFKKSEAGSLQPVMLPDEGIYAAMNLTHLPEEKQQKWESINKMLDHFYSSLISGHREKMLEDQLRSTVEKRLTALLKKRRLQKKELQDAADAPKHRLYGETLLAFGHQVPRGASSVNLPDIYNPGKQVTVPLKPSKTAAANAQDHFNRYRKAKSGQEKIKKQLRKTRSEIEYCRSLLYTIENNNADGLEEVKQEMIESGLLREKKKAARKKESAPQPLNYKASSGRTILIGKNNRQNDYITFKAAVRRDTWLHAKGIPGSHVILKEAPYPPPEEDLEEAAFLAAYHSKGRESSAVAVDYTEVRHVRRRPGGKPGFVFYENYSTITVNPQDEEMRKRFNL